MPHEDGSAYYPLVATVSLGAPIVLDLYEKDSGNDEKADRKPAFRILQEARSLLITTNELYTQYLHGIAERLTDEDLGFDSIANWEMLRDTQPFRNSSYKRQTRVSLTYRDVLKVAKVGIPVKFLTTGR
jgi:alkylated DNA repair protein alkB family protein 6